MRLTRVTITGADDGVTPYQLCLLRDEFPFVEWGLLLSASREGREPRYPSRAWLDRLFARTRGGLQLSGHLCGEWSRDAVGGPFLWAVERPDHFAWLQRLQFNGAERTPAVVERLIRFADRLPDKRFVLQAQEFGGLNPTGPNAPQLLLDRSGGRGIRLTSFPDPAPGVYCGYSGGLGPDNLRATLEALAAKSQDAEFWVDMESGVRTNEHFDLIKVRKCLEIAAEFVGAK
jgi:hypothetical protein